MSDGDRHQGSWRGITAIAVFVAMIGGSVWLWEDVLEDRLLPKRFGAVERGVVYRSGQISPALVHGTLDDHGIELVVSLCAEDPGNPEHAAEARAAADLGIERVIFPLEGDGTGDIRNYARAIAALVEAREAGRPVLVHCAAGSYRTGGVVAAYRMLVQGVDPAAAYEEMRRYDWDPDDPILPEYLNTHLEELARLLVDMGVIARIPDPMPVFGPPRE